MCPVGAVGNELAETLSVLRHRLVAVSLSMVPPAASRY